MTWSFVKYHKDKNKTKKCKQSMHDTKSVVVHRLLLDPVLDLASSVVRTYCNIIMSLCRCCTFELSRCTRNRATYISTFRCANLMFLDYVQSFSMCSTARNGQTTDSIVATWDISHPGKRLGWIHRIGLN